MRDDVAVAPNADTTDGPYLLMKRGLYWRIKSAGYTGIKEAAERYSAADVARRADALIDNVAKARRGDHENVYAIREADAPAYLNACFSDVLAEHASATVERLTRERNAEAARLGLCIEDALRNLAIHANPRLPKKARRQALDDARAFLNIAVEGA